MRRWSPGEKEASCATIRHMGGDGSAKEKLNKAIRYASTTGRSSKLIISTTRTRNLKSVTLFTQRSGIYWTDRLSKHIVLMVALYDRRHWKWKKPRLPLIFRKRGCNSWSPRHCERHGLHFWALFSVFHILFAVKRLTFQPLRKGLLTTMSSPRSKGNLVGRRRWNSLQGIKNGERRCRFVRLVKPGYLIDNVNLASFAACFVDF